MFLCLVGRSGTWIVGDSAGRPCQGAVPRVVGVTAGERGMQRAAAVGQGLGSRGSTVEPLLNVGSWKSPGESVLDA